MADLIRVGSRVINLDQMRTANLYFGQNKMDVLIYFREGDARFSGAEADALRQHFDAFAGSDLIEQYSIEPQATAAVA